MDVADNIATLAQKLVEVEAHPMCASFSDAGGYYTVMYPCGMWPDGARASQGSGKALALTRLLAVMERHWQENGIHGTCAV